MCFGINGDILLYMSYLSKDIEILEDIIYCAQDYAQDWVEFSFDNAVGKIEYLKYVELKEQIKLLTEEEKEEEKENKAEIEQNEVKNVDSENIPEIYSYDEEEANNELNIIVKAIKLLELISKMLPNFSGTFISGELKKECVKIVYEYPNKIIYKMFGEISENFEEVVKEIKNDVPEMSEDIGKSAGKIEKQLAFLTMQSILAVYYIAAINATNAKTLRILDKYENNDTTSSLQNIFMHINYGSFDDFYKKVMKLSKEHPDKVINIILKFIIRQYYSTQSRSIYGDREKLIQHFFGEEAVKDFKMEGYKKKVIKKE